MNVRTPKFEFELKKTSSAPNSKAYILEQFMIISKTAKTISILTPTGFIYRVLRRCLPKKDAFSVSWAFDQAFLFIAIALIAAHILSDYLCTNTRQYFVYFSIIQISRCIEIPFGFFSDLMDKIHEDTISQASGTGKRMALSIIVYFEIILNYSLIYSLLSAEQWNLKLALSMLDSMYFSVITMATLGYGDISPAGAMAKLLTMSEVMTSLIIIAISFTIYAGSKK